MKRNEPVFAGIDGGGTRSVAVAVDSTGTPLAAARAGSLNFLGSSLPTARRNLEKLIGSLQRRLSPKTQFRRIVVGCAALFSDATKEEKEKLCRGILPLERTHVVSDSQPACFGATLGRPGLIVIAGTGSIVLAWNDTGQLTRVGGWGYLLGDGGSAYWIAVESVKAAIAAEEGLGPRTLMSPVIRRWFAVRKLTEIAPVIYGPDFEKQELAALSSHLARKIGNRDAVSRGVCRRAGLDLAAQSLTVLKRAGTRTQPLPVCLLGGVLRNNARVRNGLVAALKKHCAVRFIEPRLSPAPGAAAMALVECGVELTTDVVANLAKIGKPQNRDERLR